MCPLGNVVTDTQNTTMTMYHPRNDAIIDNQLYLPNSDHDRSTVLIKGLMLDHLRRVHRHSNRISQEKQKDHTSGKDLDLSRW
jgi:hypothetical protein